MQVQAAAIPSSMDVCIGSDHAQPLPAVPSCASTASTSASSLALQPTAAASDSGHGLVQGSDIMLRNGPSGVIIAPLPRYLSKEDLVNLGGRPIREFRMYLKTHWHCTNCKWVWHAIPLTIPTTSPPLILNGTPSQSSLHFHVCSRLFVHCSFCIWPNGTPCGVCKRPSTQDRDSQDSRTMEMMSHNFESFPYALSRRFAQGRDQRHGKSASSGAYGRSDYEERVNAGGASFQGVQSLSNRREFMHGVHLIDWW